jgi:hypothetical protein
MSIFVFGSNKAGRHGKGAALCAMREHGAIYGKGEGHFGNSYAIPTKDQYIVTLPLDKIYDHVKKFIAYANAHPELTFSVTRIGCGLAGYKDHQIAPMFRDAPNNCQLPDGWR